MHGVCVCVILCSVDSSAGVYVLWKSACVYVSLSSHPHCTMSCATLTWLVGQPGLMVGPVQRTIHTYTAGTVCYWAGVRILYPYVHTYVYVREHLCMCTGSSNTHTCTRNVSRYWCPPSVKSATILDEQSSDFSDSWITNKCLFQTVLNVFFHY